MSTFTRLQELLFQGVIRVIDLQSGKIGLVGATKGEYSFQEEPIESVKIIFKDGFVWTTPDNVREISPLEELARIEEDN